MLIKRKEKSNHQLIVVKLLAHCREPRSILMKRFSLWSVLTSDFGIFHHKTWVPCFSADRKLCTALEEGHLDLVFPLKSLFQIHINPQERKEGTTSLIVNLGWWKWTIAKIFWMILIFVLWTKFPMLQHWKVICLHMKHWNFIENIPGNTISCWFFFSNTV